MTYSIIILEMEKLRHKEFKYLAPKSGDLGINPDAINPESKL